MKFVLLILVAALGLSACTTTQKPKPQNAPLEELFGGGGEG